MRVRPGESTEVETHDARGQDNAARRLGFTAPSFAAGRDVRRQRDAYGKVVSPFEMQAA